MLKFGAVTLSATNGTTDTSGYTAMPYTSATAIQNLTAVNAVSNYGIASGFTLTIGTQVRYDSTKVFVDYDGIVYAVRSASGITPIIDRSPVDFIARQCAFTIVAGVVVIYPDPLGVYSAQIVTPPAPVYSSYSAAQRPAIDPLGVYYTQIATPKRPS